MNRLNPEDFRREWFRRFVPESRRELARAWCFPKGERAPDGTKNDHLWHAFGWRYIDCLEGAAARAAFLRRVEKEQGEGKKPLLYKEHENALCEWDFDVESLGTDMYITAPDFRWTYCTGDESGIMGPYFARI